MPRRLQFSLRTALIAVLALALVTWPTTRWLRTYLANRGLVPVKGLVTYNGQPVFGAKVAFSPQAGGPSVKGVTSADGNYELESLVKPGQYTVGIAQGTGTRRLPPKYADGSTSGLTVNVSESGANHFAFDLRD